MTMASLRSANTEKSYLTGWRAFQAYLTLPGSDGQGTILDEWTPLTASALSTDDLYFTGFAAYLKYDRGLSFDTARKYLVGVKAVLQCEGLNPALHEMPILLCFKKAWRRQDAIARSDSTPLRPKSSLSHEALLRIVGDHAIPSHLRAAIWLGFHTLSRVSELLSMDWRNVVVSGPVVKIFLRSSKTDPFRIGQFASLTLVTWDRFVLLLGSGTIPPTGLIFPSVTRAILAKILGQGTHSMRRGGAQHLFNTGFSLDTIKRRGRWASDAWRAYIDTTSVDLGLVI